MRNSLVYLSFLIVLLQWSIGQALGQIKSQEEHSCAAARVNTTPRLLADGITSPGHKDLMAQYDVHWYKLDIGLERNSLDVAGQVTITASALVPLSKFAFELHPNLVISSLKVNGAVVSVQRQTGEAVAELSTTFPKGAKFTVQIDYAGRAPSGASAAIGNGLNTGVAPMYGNQVTWSLSEPFAAYEWFPVKQLLADKADSVDVWVTTDVANKVGSNGLLQRVTPLPNQKHRFEWKSTYPIAYYLISVAVSDYQEYSFNVALPGVAQPMLVQNYLYKSPDILTNFKSQIDQTGPLLQTFSEAFGVYPFYKEKYGHSMAPIGGGMEHQTMTTQSTFTFTLTAHELGHQWWGDEVTCKDWSHIWLNEGFATYSEYIALQKLMSSQAKGWLNTTHQNALKLPQGSVFVKDSTNVVRIFNSALSYSKGAFVLHMLRKAVKQDAVFFQVLREYRQEYRYKVANTRDFQKVVERVTGQSFQTFFDQWVYGEGFPIFDITWGQQDKEAVLKVAQTGSSVATPFFKTEVELQVTTDAVDTVVVVAMDEPIETLKFKVRGTIFSVQVDPNQWLLDVLRSSQKDPSLNPEKPVTPSTNLVAYPNPVSSRLYLQGEASAWEEVMLIDMLGRSLKKVMVQDGSIEVGGLRAGSYLLRLKKGQAYNYVRFIKL